MRQVSGQTGKNSETSKGSRNGTGLDSIIGLKSREALQEGIGSVAGAARLSIAAAEDMLDGKLTPQEATVLNTTSGRILKASELYLKFARGDNKHLSLPE